MAQRSSLALVLSVMLTMSTSWSAHAWEVSISGKVMDTEGYPVDNALVTFVDEADSMLVFSDSTDWQGRYAILMTAVEEQTDKEVAPNGFALLQNYPNPFNPTTAIPYLVKETSHVRLSIYNVLGQCVRTLIDEWQEAGRHTSIWDARDDQGAALGAGVYICRMEAGSHVQSRKLVLMDGSADPREGRIAKAALKPTSFEGMRSFTVKITKGDLVCLLQSGISLPVAGTRDLDFQAETRYPVERINVSYPDSVKPVVQYSSQPEEDQKLKWAWNVLFEETTGRIGFKITERLVIIYDAKGYGYMPFGYVHWQSIGEVIVEPEGTGKYSYWCRCSKVEATFCGGRGALEFSGVDDYGNPIHVKTSVNLAWP